MKRTLPNVTLLGIDCVNVERLQVAMAVCLKDFEFGAVKLLTSLPTSDPHAVKISHIGTIEEYSRFCIEDLHKYVDTEFVLLVQYDGFILNPVSWSDEFLKYDYIGSPWLVMDWSAKKFNFPESAIGTYVVGNGGFCIRSKKFLETTSRFAREGLILKIKMNPEDVALCVWYRELMEKEGIRFATVGLAKKFSVEGENPAYENQFGFHSFAYTNIDAWITKHPEYQLIEKEYRQAQFETQKRRAERAHKAKESK